MKRNIVLAVAGGAAVATIAGAFLTRSQPTLEPNAVSTIPAAAVVQATKGDLVKTITLSAEFKPFQEADLHAKVVLTRKNPAACTAAMHEIEKRMDRVSGDYNAFWAERDLRLAWAVKLAHASDSVRDIFDRTQGDSQIVARLRAQRAITIEK